jgi:hypothetical protein
MRDRINLWDVKGSEYFFEISLPFLFGKFLDCVAEASPWDSIVVFLQELLKGFFVALACFPQHPADTLVDEILLIFKKLF